MLEDWASHHAALIVLLTGVGLTLTAVSVLSSSGLIPVNVVGYVAAGGLGFSVLASISTLVATYPGGPGQLVEDAVSFTVDKIIVPIGVGLYNALWKGIGNNIGEAGANNSIAKKVGGGKVGDVTSGATLGFLISVL
jgi:hypothetical protein